MVLYLVGTTLIGIYAVRKSKDVQDYLVAKRNLGALMVTMLLFGEMISGAATVGKADGRIGQHGGNCSHIFNGSVGPTHRCNSVDQRFLQRFHET